MRNPGDRLLQQHKEHLGVYARIAKKLKTSPSYVSLVARGTRRSEKIMSALLRELRRIESTSA